MYMTINGSITDVTSVSSVSGIVDHLFRHESGKMVSVLVRLFGSQHIEQIEDSVQDALVRAMELWKIKGVPANPTAWLIQVAKNRMLDTLRRNKRSVPLVIDTDSERQHSSGSQAMPSGDLLQEELHQEELIRDDLLRMMFTCCHPSIGTEAQSTLILKILCGFSTAEIAKAFLTNEETIQKRLYRAKELFRERKVVYKIPSANELPERLTSVLQAIYLLFNEGYNSTHAQTAQPQVFAQMALICFHAARTDGRLDANNNIVLLPDQNRSRWDDGLIERGIYYLGKSATGEIVSRFHLEAGIAYEHCIAPSFAETNWKAILDLYDILLQVAPTLVAELNRAVVLAEAQGVESALAALQNLDAKPLANYYLYHALLGDMLRRLGRTAEARPHLERALALTKAPAEQRLLRQKLSFAHNL
jgi:RNA polymerase sigma factor (sigma-70 family)